MAKVKIQDGKLCIKVRGEEIVSEQSLKGGKAYLSIELTQATTEKVKEMLVKEMLDEMSEIGKKVFLQDFGVEDTRE